MPSNGSRHNDDALGRAHVGKDNDEDPKDRARGEGEALAPEREVSEDSERGDSYRPKVRDLRASRGDAPGIPNVYEGLSPDLTTGTDPAERVAMLAKERDELLDALRRVQADFENYKKRIE